MITCFFFFNENSPFCKDRHRLSIICRDLHYFFSQKHCAMSTDSLSVMMYFSVMQQCTVVVRHQGHRGRRRRRRRRRWQGRHYGKRVKCKRGYQERETAGETIGSQRGGPLVRVCGGRRLHYLQFEEKQEEE